MRLLSNGSILGKSITPTSSAATGVWNLYDNFISAGLNSWPGVGFTVV